VTSIRITSLRGNAATAGIPFSRVQALLAMSDNRLSVDFNNFSLSEPSLGLAARYPEVATSPSCQGGVRSLDLMLEEGSEGAFRRHGAPQSVWTSDRESGYFAPGSNNGGGASQGTRFLLRFFNIPQGVSLTLPEVLETGDTNVEGDGLRLEWVSGADASGAGGSVSSTPGDAALTPQAGFAYAV
jgi:hypothetical protein